MFLYIRVIFVILTWGSLLACTPKPPLYGPKSCVDVHDNPTNLIPYLTPQAFAAVCMPPEASVYITCVRELSQSSLAASSNYTASVSDAIFQALADKFKLPLADSSTSDQVESRSNPVASKNSGSASQEKKSPNNAGMASPSPSTGINSAQSVGITYSDVGRTEAFRHCEVLARGYVSEPAQVTQHPAAP